ncbi:hypothetical protein AMATHDRAFT_63658 [Amanita thiersii Skay4041]|uniref:Transmembrane protein 19 n=1 Tax=Amanita thiersii Skay4041 TaxID=703135 RepID=A0A2A9NN67_9AGAR|nr:hypothetical protein AMATHDRAFT_63658 [Amanita thiersii Skay4041]
MAASVRAFGVGLIGFYLLGSRATKFGKQQKARLEEGYHEAGYRNGWQVLCNSAFAFVATSVWNVYYVPGSPHAWVAELVGFTPRNNGITYRPDSWCPTDGQVSGGWSRVLVFIVLGQFACCLGDTLASELGVLSRAPPRMVTNFKKMPPGTNGAMSVGGTLASAAGGILVGLMMGVSLVIENRRCGRNVLMECVLWGGFAGVIGSLIDSIMGATLQKTLYNEDKKIVVKETGKGVKNIGGWEVLTNNQVNLLSSGVCGLVVAWMTSR